MGGEEFPSLDQRRVWQSASDPRPYLLPCSAPISDSLGPGDLCSAGPLGEASCDGAKGAPSGHIKDCCWVGVRTPPIPWQLGFPEHLPGLACCWISPSALQGQAGADCSGFLCSGGRGGELRALFSFPQCQGCSPLPGPDQPWESGYLGCEGLSL